MVNKVTEGRPHMVDMIKNNEIALVINTVEERRNAIADSRAIRTSALLARVTTFTTIAGAEAAVEGMRYMDNLDVISVQEMHAQLRPSSAGAASGVLPGSPAWHNRPINTPPAATSAVFFWTRRDHGHHPHHQARRRKAARTNCTGSRPWTAPG